MNLVLNHNAITRALKAILGFMVLCLMGGMVYFIYQHEFSTKYKQEEVSFDRPVSQRFDIRGFEYDGFFQGKRVVTIKADRVSVEKKKLGFFRFGLMNVARIENAMIRLYGREEFNKKKDDGTYDNIEKSLSFKKVLSKEALPSFPVKRVSSIMIGPVVIELRDERSIITRISASSGVINLVKRDISFEGNIKVKSGGVTLKADRINFYPEQMVFITDGHFVLKTPQKEWEGQRLTTDIYLRPVSS